MRGGKRVLGYARAGEGASVGAQRAAIAAACAQRGWELVRVEAEGGSGGKSSRPARARALEAVRAGEAQTLVVARLDRLAGSLSQAARLLERAKGEGWNLVALDLGLDLSTAAGKRIANAFATVARWERRLRSERAREALARARAGSEAGDAAQGARAHGGEDQAAARPGREPAGDRGRAQPAAHPDGARRLHVASQLGALGPESRLLSASLRALVVVAFCQPGCDSPCHFVLLICPPLVV